MLIPPTTIRLVAVDLDGTLLTDQKQVTPTTVTEMAHVAAAGTKIVIASARPPRSVRQIYHQLKLDTLQINYNGALIWDEPARRTFHHTPMPGELVARITTAARRHLQRVIITSEILDRWHTDRDDQSHTTETGRLFPPDVIAPLQTFAELETTKLMFLADPSDIDVLLPLLLTKFDREVTILRTDPNLLQLMNPAAGKATALQRLADHYAIPMNQVMAIGDAVNDIGMLQLSGVAVAMGNATAAVKAVGDWIAPTNNENGVVAALKRYCPEAQ